MAATLVYQSQRGNRPQSSTWQNPAAKHYRNASRLIDAIFTNKSKGRIVVFHTSHTEIVKENGKVLTIRLRRN